MAKPEDLILDACYRVEASIKDDNVHISQIRGNLDKQEVIISKHQCQRLLAYLSKFLEEETDIVLPEPYGGPNPYINAWKSGNWRGL